MEESNSNKGTPGKPSKMRNGGSSGYESNEGDNIKVYVRVRPPAKNLENGVDRMPCIEVTSANSIQLLSKPDPKTFSYDHVADINTMQEEVFGAVGKKIVEGCVNGYNGTIFAYGQTGSGKTFTMLGPAEGEIECFTHQLRGVIPRSFEYLFSLIKREQEKHGDHLEFLCRCSFLEIYNEQIYDLLDPASSGLALREDLKRGIFVDGLLERDVASAKDAYSVLNSGWLNRRVASTSMNRESSRSHAVFTVTLESKEKKTGMCNIKVSKLHLVDLAGSERQRDTHAKGLRLKEASSINKSLSALGNVIMALVDITHGKNRHVHYRDSKLTFLLRDSLGGNARTYIIANVHPSAKCFGETLSTLNFARRAKMIKNRAVINEDSTGSVTALQAEIRKLREELTQARAGVQKQVTRQERTDNDTTSSRDQSCSGDSNNNSGNDYPQQYKEWREMIIAATEGRERSEQETLTYKEKIRKLEELCSKKDKFVQSTKMILKFRESHIAKLERMKKGNKEEQEREEDSRDQQIQLLNEEITILKEKIEHHPDVTRFAMENLELRGEIKKLRHIDDEGNDMDHELAKSHRYTLQLERQLRDLLQSPQGSVDLERSLSSSLLNLEASNAELEKFKSERSQLNSQIDSAREELQQTRDDLQKTKEKLVNEGEIYRKKVLDLESELSSLKKANAELEKALEAFQLKTAVERTTLNDIHMQTIKTLTSPRKSITPNRLAPHSAASTPQRGDKSKLNINKFNNSPVIDLADEKPPNGMFRRDSFHDSGSDNEFDEPFFNFEDDSNDAEELYVDALMDELKKLQDMNNDSLQKMQAAESKSIKSNQTLNKQEYMAQQLSNSLASEREKHAAIETELNMKNLSLTDKLKDSKAANTILSEEIDDLKIVLQSADKELETIKKQRDLESIETGRALSSLESKVTRLEIENYNKQNEMENGIESIQNLQSEMETLQDELQFTNHKIEQYEHMLQSERQRIRELEQELQTTNEKLHFQTETNINLMAQQDSQKELVRTLEQCQSLQSDLQKSNAVTEQQANKISTLTHELEESKEVIVNLNKCSESDKECVNNLMQSVMGLKKVIGEKDSELSSLHTELEESRSQVQELADTIEEKKRKITILKEKLQKEIEKTARERQQRESEIMVAKEDLKRTAQQCKDLTEALEQQQQQITTMQNDLKDKNNKIDEIEIQRTQLVESCSAIESKYEARIAELHHLAESGDNSIVMIESQSTELEHYKTTQAKLTRALDSLEAGRQEKNEELSSMRQKLDLLKHEKEMLETKNKTLKYQLEAEIEDKTDRGNMHKKEFTRVSSSLEETTAKNDKINQELEKLRNSYQDLEAQLQVANLNKDMAEENADQMVEELERTQKSESQMFTEKEDLKSKCERFMEEKHKLETAIRKLEEENAKLNGHQNQQQKISYLLSLKRENNDLQKVIRKLKTEKEKCRCTVEQVAT